MKRMVLVLLAVVMLAGLSFAQEAEEPTGAISFLLGGAIVAPIGVGVEFFLDNFGLGGTLNGMYIGAGGASAFWIEPGAYGRFYFKEPDSSFFLMGGATFVFVGGSLEGQTQIANSNIVKIKAALGYNALFGKQNNIRFSAELGPVFIRFTDTAAVGIPTLILPHFMLMFGYAF